MRTNFWAPTLAVLNAVALAAVAYAAYAAGTFVLALVPLLELRGPAALPAAVPAVMPAGMPAVVAALTRLQWPANCQFTLGFATLETMVGPSVVGNCLENEHLNPVTGLIEQRTTSGLLVWRAADNGTAFTDGYRTWLNGPYGLQQRLNGERFCWEADADYARCGRGVSPAALRPARP